MLSSLVSYVWDHAMLAGTSAVFGAAAWPQLQNVWSKIKSTASGDVTTLKAQVAQLQSDLAAIKNPPTKAA